MPLHALQDLPGQKALRRPGRPRKIVLPPSAVETQYHATAKAARDAALASDPILCSKSSAQTVAATILELAREAAALRWDRERAEERGLDVAALISSRRVDGLSKLAAVVRDAHRAGLYGTELSPRTLGLVIDHWIKSVGEVAGEALPAESAKLFMARYVEVIDVGDIQAVMHGRPSGRTA